MTERENHFLGRSVPRLPTHLMGKWIGLALQQVKFLKGQVVQFSVCVGHKGLSMRMQFSVVYIGHMFPVQVSSLSLNSIAAARTATCPGTTNQKCSQDSHHASSLN